MAFKNVKWFPLGLFFSLSYWVLDAVRDVLVFDKGPIPHSIFFPDAMTFWLRFLVICIIILMSLYGHYISSRKISIEKINQGRIYTLRIIPVSLIFSLFYWIIESLRQWLLHMDIPLLKSMFQPNAMETWSRLLPLGMLLLLGFFTQAIVNKQVWLQRMLHENERRLYHILNQMPFPIQVYDHDGTCTMENQAANVFFHGHREKTDPTIHLSNQKGIGQRMSENILKKTSSGETVFLPRILIKDNKNIEPGVFDLTVFPVKKDGGRIWLIVAIWLEVTNKIRAEQENVKYRKQLLHTQKMNAIGNLVGGIAHDFNNIITAIQGSSDLALMNMNKQEVVDWNSLRNDFNEIRKATELAAQLTKKLLLFGTKNIRNLKSINMNALILNLKDLMTRILPENISIITDLEPTLWTTEVDTDSLEQVLMNLALNSRDAMPKGGKLVIKTRNQSFNDEDCERILESRTGKYVCIEVSDSGMGINPEIKKKIFNPFFSTKKEKNGTGLGLSVASGVIKQHNGWISVDSEIDKGTVFRLYLPVADKQPKRVTGKIMPDKLKKGSGEKILVVEDDPNVRKTIIRALDASGYHSYPAADAEEAMDMFTREREPFSLLFSDIMLPGMTGIDLAKRLMVRKPQLKVVLGSGYSRDVDRIKESLLRDVSFLQKPYHVDELVQEVGLQLYRGVSKV